jgi:protein SPA2
MELMEQLRTDLENVLAEANDLSNRNEELMAAREDDNNIIRDLNGQVKEYKRKYEQAKTELRSIKGRMRCQVHPVQ